MFYMVLYFSSESAASLTREAGFQYCSMDVKREQAGHAIIKLISNYKTVEDHT